MGTSPARRARLYARRAEKAALADARAEELRSQGHACRDCKHRRKIMDKHVCELDSDFGSKTVVPLEYVCEKWSARA